MTFVLITLILYLALLLLAQGALIFLWFFIEHDKKFRDPGSYPMVSVLLAVRNEADNIKACLNALKELSWPKDRYEVLIGNDRSTDPTVDFVSEYISSDGHFQLHHIIKDIGSAKAKANVLAQLAHKAKGDLFAITDADMQVNKDWLKALTAPFTDVNIGIVSGVTIPEGRSFFQQYQSMEWVNAFGMIKVASELEIPVTAIGNNMMVRKEAYFSTGGYEHLPFDLTEDFQLFQEVLKNGWGYKNLLACEAKGRSIAVKSLQSWLQQRRRWLSGALRIPMLLKGILGLQAMFLPALITALFIMPAITLMLLAIYFFLQVTFLRMTLSKIKERWSFTGGLAFLIIGPFLNFLQLAAYLLPLKVVWKDRQY